MSQPTHVYKAKPRYERGGIKSLHYYGPPALKGEAAEALPKEAKKPAPYMTGKKAADDNKNYTGGNWKAAYPDRRNNSPDHPVDFHDWGATPGCFEGWRHGGEDEPSYNQGPVSKSVIRKKGTFRPGTARIMDSGRRFTQVSLYVSGISDKGAYGGDFNYLGTEMSRVLGPVVSMYGSPIMKRWVTPLPKTANDDLEHRLNAA